LMGKRQARAEFNGASELRIAEREVAGSEQERRLAFSGMRVGEVLVELDGLARRLLFFSLSLLRSDLATHSKIRIGVG